MDRESREKGERKVMHVGSPNIGDQRLFFEKLENIFETKWLTNRGTFVQELEAQLAQYLGVKHCISMCNGTIALEIAIKALGLKGEVILPSFTFVATAHALQWQEITPVFCDIDADSYNLSVEKIERLITPNTTGIIGVHLYGRPCDIDALQAVSEKHNLLHMYDAAHAFSCGYKGRMIGNFGACEVFSFHATKFFNTFEGGAIATNDDVLAEKIRLMQNFGFSGYDNVIYIGSNGKMSEINAAMGIVNLQSIDEFLSVNRRNYMHYCDALSDLDSVKLIEHEDSNNSNWQYIVIELVDAGIEVRDQLLSTLHEYGVLARKYFWPGCHNMEPYKSLYPNANLLLPVTESLSKRVIVLPTGTSISSEDVEFVTSILKRHL